MAQRRDNPPARGEDKEAFFAALGQLEAITTDMELNWPDVERADAMRRLNRLIRAVRHQPISLGKQVRRRY